MNRFTPNTFVLHAPPGNRTSGSPRPPWPAIICLEEDLPHDVRQQRPNGSNIPILLLGRLSIRWALPHDVRPLMDWECPTDDSQHNGIEAAYAAVHHSFQNDWNAHYWIRIRQIHKEAQNETESYEPRYVPHLRADVPGEEEEEVPEEEEADIRAAIAASLQDLDEDATAPVTPEPSSDRSSDRSSATLRYSPDFDLSPNLQHRTRDNAKPASSPTLPFHPHPAKRPFTSHAEDVIASKRRKSSVEQDGTSFSAEQSMSLSGFDVRNDATPQVRDREPFTGFTSPFRSPAQSLFTLPTKPSFHPTAKSSFTSRAKRPVSPPRTSPPQGPSGESADDEDEIEYAEGICSFVVGREDDEQRFLIPTDRVREKSYWNNVNVHFLQPVGKDLRSHTFQHARLRDFDPEDFRHVADYLSTGEFGHRVVDNEDQASESVRECISAWTIAQQLGMYDLMELIIEKMRHAQPWEMEYIMELAKVVYDSDSVLPQHDEMKGMVATHMAENFWQFVDSHPTIMREMMQELPALERDIYEKRLIPLRSAAED